MASVILETLVTMCLFAGPLILILKPRYSLTITIIAYLAAMVPVVMLDRALLPETLQAVLPFITASIGSLIVPMLLFRGRFWFRLLVVGIQTTGLLILDITCSIASMYWFGITQEQILTHTAAYGEQTFVLVLFFYMAFALYDVLLVWFFKRKDFGLQLQQVWYFLLTPIAFLILLMTIYFSSLSLQKPPLFKLSILCALFSAVVIALMMKTMMDVERSIRTQERSAHLKQQQKLQLAHYGALEEQISQTRKLHHDIANHLQTVSALIRQGNTQAAVGCLREIDGVFAQNQLPVYCENTVINALLHQKSWQAQHVGVQLVPEISFPKISLTNELELVRSISEVLDSAILWCTGASDSSAQITLAGSMKYGVFDFQMLLPLRQDMSIQSWAWIPTNLLDNGRVSLQFLPLEERSVLTVKFVL